MLSPKKTLSFLIFLVVLASNASGLEPGGQVHGQVTWQGEVLLRQTVWVAHDAELTISPGTVIRPLSQHSKLIVAGVLKIQGNAKSPVLFSAPQGWEGIAFLEAPEGSVITYAIFERAATAVSSTATNFSLSHSRFSDGGTAVKLLREANPIIEDNLFTGNDIGVDSEMKSSATILRNRFAGHKTTAILASHNSIGIIEGNSFENNKQGVGLMQKYAGRISGNLFSGNEVGIYCNQTRETPRISGNTFVGNRLAVENVSFSSPAMDNNVFTDNDIAIRNDQLGSPRIAHNLFRDNRTAIYNYRKSNPVVEHNRLEQNELALFCDYSSYPVVHQNNFLNNGMAVKLGIYQSGDWEKQFGSKSIMQKEASARSGRNPSLSQPQTEIADSVNVSNNWWGKDTDKLVQAGKKGGVDMFHDRRVQPQVIYKEFGPESYILDVVLFTPWLTAPVADSGPVK